MQSMIISLKNIARLLVLAIAVLFYFILTTPTHAQVGIPAGGIELDGYAWSSNIGWISMNCKTGGATGNDICATSNYKATVQADGTVTGYAWSSNVGWIRFGGLSDFPAGAGTMAVNARMTGTYPDLTFEGWVRACAGDDMNASCIPTAVATSTGLIWSNTGSTTGFKVTLIGAGSPKSMAYGNGRYIAFRDGNPTTFLSSTNGITWSPVTITGVTSGDWQAITYANGRFIAVSATPINGAGQQTVWSTDGITWTTRYQPTAALKGLAYGNGLFVSVACGTGTTCNTNAGNRVFTTPDGVAAWTPRTAPIALWNAVAFGNGLFVAVSESNGPGNVMTSPDGINWTARTAPNGMWSDIEYGNGRFVATAWSEVGSLVMTSPDGINWTVRAVTEEDGFLALEFFDSLFVSHWYDTDKSGNPASFSTSPDGITWTKQSFFEPAPTGRWYSIGVGPSEIVGGTQSTGSFQTIKGVFGVATSTGTGWDGWISLRSTSAPTHSVVMSSTGASATSYAWGSTVMGWINFDDVRFLTPTATLSGTNCSIPAGASTCNSSFSWNIQNATSPNLRNSTRSVTYTTTAAGTTTPYAIAQGSNTVQARDNNTVLASVVVTGTCAAGTDFANGSTCELSVVPAPVITITTNKTIARTGDTVQVSWTMNPSPIASGTCSVSGPGMPSSVTTTGSQISNALASKTRFTLTCTGAYGTVRANADVEIIPKASEV